MGEDERCAGGYATRPGRDALYINRHFSMGPQQMTTTLAVMMMMMMRGASGLAVPSRQDSRIVIASVSSATIPCVIQVLLAG